MRASSPALSGHLALSCPRAGCSPALTPLANKYKTKGSVYTTRSKKTSTRVIRLLMPSSLKASFSFSYDRTLPDETWEVVACTTETAFYGTSSTLPTVLPGFWESREKLGLQNQTRQKEEFLYKKVQST